MLYTSVADFWEKTAKLTMCSREEELVLAAAMARGDSTAKSQLVNSYLPIVARHIWHCKKHLQTLTLVYACIQALEKAVDSFDFLQDSESFTHRLSWCLRQTTVAYIASQREASS